MGSEGDCVWQAGAKVNAQTIFRIAYTHKPYAQLGNAMLQNDSLSLEARGFLCSVLSRPANWKFSLAWMSKAHGIGREKARRIIQECTNAGYCLRRRLHDAKGRLAGVEYVFTDDPKLLKLQQPDLETEKPSVGDHLVTGFSTVGSPGDGFSTTTNKRKNKRKKKDKERVPRTRRAHPVEMTAEDRVLAVSFAHEMVEIGDPDRTLSAPAHSMQLRFWVEQYAAERNLRPPPMSEDDAFWRTVGEAERLIAIYTDAMARLVKAGDLKRAGKFRLVLDALEERLAEMTTAPPSRRKTALEAA